MRMTGRQITMTIELYVRRSFSAKVRHHTRRRPVDREQSTPRSPYPDFLGTNTAPGNARPAPGDVTWDGRTRVRAQPPNCIRQPARFLCRASLADLRHGAQ